VKPADVVKKCKAAARALAELKMSSQAADHNAAGLIRIALDEQLGLLFRGGPSGPIAAESVKYPNFGEET
jgi:hypothetical protein